MQATGIAVPADQGIAVGIKEQQLRRKTFRQILHRLLEDLRGFRHVTHVDADGRGDITVSQRPRRVGQQHDRQVIHAVKPISSSARRATDFPEPERPLTIISTMYRFSSVR